MTQGVDLRSLLERVQKAQGPDAELDREIWASLPAGSPYYDLTSSIDSAMTLVSEFLPAHVVDIHINHAENYYGSQIVNPHVTPITRVTNNSAPTPALSVLICMLQALIAKAEAEEGVGEF